MHKNLYRYQVQHELNIKITSKNLNIAIDL